MKAASEMVEYNIRMQVKCDVEGIERALTRKMRVLKSQMVSRRTMFFD